MKNIVIVGAGGLGREILCYVKDCIKFGANWEVKGFIDDNKESLKNYPWCDKIISTISDYTLDVDDELIIAICEPKVKKGVIKSLKQKGAKFASLIHPTCTIGENNTLGEGVVLCPYSGITCDASLGDFVFLNRHTSIGHNAKVGSYSSLSSYCDITGYATLGEGVFMASHSCVAPSVKVGNWSRVGINSAVISKIKDNNSVFGTPAQKINY